MSAGVSGANSIMANLMQTLMQGMQKQLATSQQMIAIGVENSISAEKMATAQQIIDVYA